MKHIGDLMNTAATCAIFLGIAAAIIAPIYPSAEVLPAVEPITSYYGYKLVRLPTGGNIDKVTSILKSLNLRTWEISHTFADIMVPPEMLEAFSAETTDLTGSKILYEDLGVAIEKERQQLYASTASNTARQVVDGSWFTVYHTYDDHLQFLDNLVAEFPNNAEIVTSGTSSEGRTITGIHIFGSAGGGANPAVVFHGTVHAREWIATLAVEYNAYSLLTNYSTDPQTQGWVDKYDFYLFPIVNPDGFIYSQTNDRLWRKNRQILNGSSCVGIDLNRNWPYKWDLPDGASTDPCNELYRGEAAGDSTEIPGLIAKLSEIKTKQGLKLYIDWHSPRQQFMSPYGYDCDLLPTNNDQLQNILQGAVAAITMPFNTSYESGPVCSTLYKITGGSTDYLYDVLEAPYAFMLELRDSGDKQFILPAEDILPTSIEAYEGVKYVLDNIA